MGTIVLGPVCKRGHNYGGKSRRYASTRQCVDCHKIWLKNYKQLPHRKEYARRQALSDYYERHEHHLKRMAKYRKTKNFKESVKRYRERNREELAVGCREWRLKNKKRVSVYNKWYIQTEHGRAITKYKIHRRRKRVVAVPYTAEQLKSRLRRFGDACVYCGSAKKKSIDHLIPIALGGLDCMENLVPACGPCNAKKNKLHPLTFVRRIGGSANLRRRIKALVNHYWKTWVEA